MKGEMKHCEDCNKELKPLNPPVEDYITHKFCIKIFGWKLMLLKDYIEYGCPDCLVEKEDGRKRDDFEEAVSYAIQEEIAKGHLIINQ